MSTFYQTNDSGKSQISHSEERSINIPFGVEATAPNVYPQLQLGEVVTLNAATGEIVRKTTDDQIAIGVVIKANRASDPTKLQKATVRTYFSTVIQRGAADVAVQFGTLLRGAPLNATTNLAGFVQPAVGKNADAVALGVAGANEEVRVGILRSPVIRTV